MKRLSDFLADYLVQQGITEVFMLTGGGAMHLNDAFGSHPQLHCTFLHHEQACAMAAESYARIAAKPALLNVTTGPGSLNALNGVFGAWTDSIPMIVISGQVKRETCLANYDLPNLRQLGDQEVDIISMVKSITKYAVTILEPESIFEHIKTAVKLATTGRPGPVWLDIPVDVQSAKIEVPESFLNSSLEKAENLDSPSFDLELVETQVKEVCERLIAAKRPVILLGSGVRISPNGYEKLHQLLEEINVPITTAWTAHDLIESDHRLYCGRPGTVGDRPGNFTVQNSDFLLVIGSRLHIRQISYNWKSFAHHAFIAQVDIDKAELNKPTVTPDLAIQCDAGYFIEQLQSELKQTVHNEASKRQHQVWLDWCIERKQKYPVVGQHQREITTDYINPYHFVDSLYKELLPTDTIVCGDGTACVVPFQVASIKRGQRLYTNAGCASMGYDLPAAIGAATAKRLYDGSMLDKRVICLAGEGSLQLNIQELQSIVYLQYPIKIFVLNNGGYLSIRMTQKNFFGRLVGEGPESGVTFPDIVKLAQAYGITALQIKGQNFMEGVTAALETPGPFLCEVLLDPAQEFEPKTSSKILPDGKMVSAALEDLYPFLSAEELKENMIVATSERN